MGDDGPILGERAIAYPNFMDESRPRPPRSQRPGSAARFGKGASLQLFNTVAAGVAVVGTLGVLLLGRQAGFQHYLIIVPPVLALQPNMQRSIRGAAIALAVVAYVVLDAMHPVWAVPEGVAEILYSVNASVGLLLLGAMAFVYGGQLSSMQARLQRTAATDLLTGLLNRRSWLDSAEGLLERAQRGGRQTGQGLLLVGVDHLKSVNDRHGNGTGDQVLGTVAAALQHGLRERDLLARWGGDQFIALLARSDAKTVRMVAERMRALVQAATLRVAVTGDVLPLTISIGITVVEASESLDTAIARVDKALTEAKQAGRNRVVVSRG